MRDAADTTPRRRTWSHGLFERPPILHPWLAPLPALLTYTHDNLGMATWRLALFPLVLTWTLTLPLLLLLSAVGRSARTGALATTLCVVAFHAHEDAGDAATWMWGAVAIATVALLAYRGAGDALTQFGNVFLVLGALPALWTTFEDERADPAPHIRPDYLTSLAVTPDAARVASGALPDIWYVVLDGYGREDVLRDGYGVPGGGLSTSLRKRGFYVAERACANYAQTALSIASALNLAPLGELLDPLPPESTNRLPLKQLVASSRVTHALRRAGYRIVQYRGEYSVTQMTDVDENRGTFFAFNEYDYILWARTPILALARAVGLPQQRFGHAVRRHAIDAVLDDLPRGDRDPGPTFVYVHLVAPHPPFVFAPDGSYRRSRSRMFFGDGSTWHKYARKYKENYEEGYRDQVAWLDRRIEEAVDGILAHAERPPIILIQGDHGPGSHLDWSDPIGTDMRERMAILSAFYLPDTTKLWPTITPVNALRVVLDQAIGSDLGRTADRSWFSAFTSPYALIDQTERLAAE